MDNKLNTGIRRLWSDKPTHKISVLLPTRKRTDLLMRSLLSLIDHADEPSSMEILLGFDNDDQESINWAKENIFPILEAHNIDGVVVEFHPLGYEKLNEYLNVLASVCGGEWVFFWNDDAVMESKGWDTKIYEHTGKFEVLRVKTHNEHPYSIFPILPRDWYYLLGHLSNHQLNDASISQIAYMLDIMRTIDVTVLHDRHDLTGNNKDDTFKERKIFEGNHLDPRDFNYITARQKRIEDANKIAWYLERIGQPSPFFREVMHGRRDPWEKMLNSENDPNNQVKIIV